MREYILTERERKILKTFVNEGIKLNGFTVLVLRLRRASKTLRQDMELVNATLEKLKNFETLRGSHNEEIEES
jgi:hypothetical protein